MATTQQLPAEVAEHYELTTTATRMHVRQLDREVDLTKLTLAEAAELVALPGGFQWLRRRPEPAVVVEAVTAEKVPARAARPRKARAPKNGSPGGR